MRVLDHTSRRCESAKDFEAVYGFAADIASIDCDATQAWLGALDELSVWYMRFNRSRLRGQTELDDNASALNTVLTALYYLGVGLVSFHAKHP